VILVDLVAIFEKGGWALLAVVIMVAAVKVLYNDMQQEKKQSHIESNQREDRLMNYLDKKNETDAKIAETMENINEELKCVNDRITNVENAIGGSGHGKV
jgi:predicted Holliday junction resolvase-like endonuclease